MALKGNVTIYKLEPDTDNPETNTYSTEYLDWCKSHNRTPCGNNLNIGNFVNLAENLTTYRTIMYNNTQERNSFSIRK